ncbi:hypothetical protein KM043_006820 [Ampulex compressa]|nr:hypothetical protein KM043_006820 [Ampulex compressa]
MKELILAGTARNDYFRKLLMNEALRQGDDSSGIIGYFGPQSNFLPASASVPLNRGKAPQNKVRRAFDCADPEAQLYPEYLQEELSGSSASVELPLSTVNDVYRGKEGDEEDLEGGGGY